ncbi:putative Rho-type GTPase-activating protein 2 [Yarrowia sp. E02]|nr:putative Rho-type GTPase-activating protein 2 [Yarrowia sp. E02]
MPTLKDSYTLWANQMAVSTPSSPPQQNSVFGQGSESSLRSTLGMRKRRDKRASVSSISSPARSMSVRRSASTSKPPHNGLTPTYTNGSSFHPSPPKRNASLHNGKVKSAGDDNSEYSEPQTSALSRSHLSHARAPSNSSLTFPLHPHPPSDVFAPDQISLHHKTDSMSSSSDLDTLEQLVQPDLSMPDKTTASLEQLYNLLAERTVQLSHNSYQNTQLWTMVNKQRQMILDLQRDLDSSLEVNARYKRRLLRAAEANKDLKDSPNTKDSNATLSSNAKDIKDTQDASIASTGNSIPGNTPATNGSTSTVVVATTAPQQLPSDDNSTTATSAKSAVSSTPSPNGSTSSVATSINNPSAPATATAKHVPQPIVPLPYPLPAISSAREPKGFSFEEDRDTRSHRKTKSDTLNDDSFLVPEKSPSRDPRLHPKKSMASVVSSDETTPASVPMSKSASMGAAVTPTTPSLPPPALAPEPITLYVKPTELSTIRVDVASSLGVARKKDTPVVVISVADRATCKELWRCSKEYSAFVALDNAVTPQIPSFKTKIPDRSLFTSHAPARVDIRKDQLNGWFGSLLAIPRLPGAAAQTLCEFLSTNTMDPLDVPDGDARKEGFLTKRGKSFGGWKLRYFVLDGPMLNYYESPNGPHLGAIRLYNARIGRQTQEEDSNSEDAYRHAFLVMEPRKKDYVRHVLCAENDRERDDWIEALLEFVTLPEPDSPVKSIHSPAITTVTTNTSTLNAYGESIYDEYAEAPTPTLPTTEAIDHVMESQRGTGLGIDVGGNDPAGNSNHGMHPGPAVLTSSNNRGISAPIASEPIQNLQKWGYKYSPSSQSLSQQLQGDGLDDHLSQSPNHNHLHSPAIQAPIPEVKEKKKFFLFRKGNSDRQNNQQQQSTPEYLQSVLEAEGMIQREERPSTPSLTTPTQSHFDTGDYHQSGVFGVPLLQAIESSSKDIDGHVVPSVVWRCIQYLDDQKAHLEEGIFRLSGSASAIRILKARFNDHYDIDLVSDSSTVFDVHAVAGLLKLFLREMPSLILTQQLSPAFRRAMEIPDIVNRIYELKKLVKQLPAESRDLLFVLAQYLCKIIEHQDYNKMNLRNVGIVFSPTVNVPAGIFVLFLTDFDCIFGDAQPRTDINRKLQDFPQALLG